MSQQGLRQASARAITGSTTDDTYNDDLMKAFQAEATIPDGATFDEACLIWINEKMTTSYTNINEAMQAFAESRGAANWQSLGTLV